MAENWMGKKVNHVRELNVYRESFDCAMLIFEVTKGFPAEEKYSLVDQIRRSSRSVCANLAEAWQKRKYRSYFKNKLTDAMQEASETQTWLDFSLACGYIDQKTYDSLTDRYQKIIFMLNRMDLLSEKFCY